MSTHIYIAAADVWLGAERILGKIHRRSALRDVDYADVSTHRIHRRPLQIPDFDLVIRNGTLVSSSGRRIADVAIADGRIAAVARTIGETAAHEIDAAGLFVLPGLIDEHVHFREPGLEHEETWETGTRAAVFGGVTTVLDMPNTQPPTDTAARAREKRALAEASAHCDFGIFGLLGESEESVAALVASGLVVGLKAFLGPTTGGLRAPDDEVLRRALVIARAAGLRVAFHAEDRRIVERAEAALLAAARADALAHLEARPPEAEAAAIARVGALLVATGAAGHVLHVSSAAGLAEIEKWRRRGADLTCEVTPHHLFLDRDVYRTARGVARVNPPIRGGEDAAALRDALADGRIDTVGSDHAPHLAADKKRESIWDVPCGFAGVETMLPLLLTRGVIEGSLTLERLVHATSEMPAKLWGLWPRKGNLDVGSDADITIVDLARAGQIAADTLHGKNNLSPFEGWPTRGAPVATIVRGRIATRDGELMKTIKRAG
jgi:dihydroorotase